MFLAALLAATAALSAAGGTAGAQTFPTRPITLIVPWAAGGTTDVTLRNLAATAEKQLGQAVIVENRPGASGTLSPMQMAATAKPDGYTLAQIPLSVLRLPPLRKAAFDPATDLTYIIGLTGYTFGMVVRHDAPWKTFRELIADARAHPGKIRYGTPGAWTTPHIAMEQIARHQGFNWVHVPFTSTLQANAVLGGHIDVATDATNWAPLVNDGKLRLLVTFGARRTVNWPNVPTLRDIGIDLVANSPYGLAGPKGVDPKIVKVLHDAFKVGLEHPSYAALLAQFDQELFYLDSRDYHDFAMRQIAEQKRFVEELGLRQD